MADIERKLTFEVLVLQRSRWTVVDLYETREEALASAERLRIGNAGVRVTIERYDPRNNTYTATTVWEWLAPRRRSGPHLKVDPREPPRPVPKGSSAPQAQKGWWQAMVDRLRGR